MMSASFASLRIPQFRRIWLTEGFSLLGNSVHFTALTWLVTRMTASPWALGALGVAYFVPPALLSPIGGVAADRLPRREILVTTELISGGVAAILGFLALAGRVQLWELYILASIRGAALAFELPAFRGFLLDLVGREALPNAMALESFALHFGRVVGPALGGLAIAYVSPAGAFLFNAVSFVPSAIAIWTARPAAAEPPPAKTSSAGLWPQIREGLVYLKGSPKLSMVFILIFVVGTCGANFGVVVPLVARHVLHVGPERFGLLSSCLGLGSLVGSAVLTRARTPSVAVALVSAGLIAVSLPFLGRVAAYAPSAALFGLASLCVTAFAVSSSALITLLAPGELRGRVSSLQFMMGFVAAPIASVVTGALAEYLGVRNGLAAQGGLCALGIAVAVVTGASAARSKARSDPTL